MHEQQQYVEDVGVYFEKAGLTRMAGRIIGWLLICDPPLQTMQDIGAALGASKSAISTALWQLQQYTLVDRVSLPGERRDYYRVRGDMFYRSWQARMSQLVEIRLLAERGLALLEDASEEQRQRLQMMHDFNLFLEREFSLLLERWEAEKRTRGYPNL
jgi:DNA-binding transcriptional regulator GbsR (MarR family)